MQLQLFGYACGVGAENIGCEDGPETVHHSSLLAPLQDHFHWQHIYSTDIRAQKRNALPEIARICTQLAKDIQQCVQQKLRFLTIGGDHSCGIGTWSGAACALQEKGDLGLIWIDAHLDSHTFSTSPSNNIHGMPVAALLGEGEDALTLILSKSPKLKSSNIVIIGVRSYESEEQRLLKKLGVKIYYVEEIIQRGFSAILNEAIAIVSKKTAGFGFSLDLDGIDPKDAPGVGSPVKNGLRAIDLLKNLFMLTQHPAFIGAEVAEFNPHLDQQQKTEQFIVDIIKALVY